MKFSHNFNLSDYNSIAASFDNIPRNSKQEFKTSVGVGLPPIRSCRSSSVNLYFTLKWPSALRRVIVAYQWTLEITRTESPFTRHNCDNLRFLSVFFISLPLLHCSSEKRNCTKNTLCFSWTCLVICCVKHRQLPIDVVIVLRTAYQIQTFKD